MVKTPVVQIPTTTTTKVIANHLRIQSFQQPQQPRLNAKQARQTIKEDQTPSPHSITSPAA
jgi:hypothetical protein